MRWLFFLALVGCACGASNGKRVYQNNDLELAVGNAARNGCSCRYVMKLSEEQCRAWVRANPDVASVRFDDERQRVESAAFISWSAVARVVDARRGCVLE